MKWWQWLLVGLAGIVVIGALGGEEDEDEDARGGGQTRERPAADYSPSEASPPKPAPERWPVPKKAIAELENLGSEAVAAAGGLTDMDLLPSEKGARTLIERGLDEQAFCSADGKAFEAETLVEADRAFTKGWESNAPPELEDMGSTIYNALSVACLL